MKPRLHQKLRYLPLSWTETQNRSSIRTCAKHHDDFARSKPYHEFFQSDWMIRQSCRECIFSCRTRSNADFQVLEIDTSYLSIHLRWCDECPKTKKRWVQVLHVTVGTCHGLSTSQESTSQFFLLRDAHSSFLFSK